MRELAQARKWYIRNHWQLLYHSIRDLHQMCNEVNDPYLSVRQSGSGNKQSTAQGRQQWVQQLGPSSCPVRSTYAAAGEA